MHTEQGGPAPQIVPAPPRLMPPHYFFIALVLVGGAALADGAPWLPAWVLYPGIAAIAVGMGLALVAARQFDRAGTNIVPFSKSSTLVTSGAFRFTRNPMYLGMLLILGGAALATRDPWPWLVWIAFFAVLRVRFVANEEILMEQTFTDAYRAYRARVRRWL